MSVKSIKRLICAGAFACLAGTAHAQEDWPTVGDLLDDGIPLADGELVELLDGKTGIHVLQFTSALFGRIFMCEGLNSPSFGFTPPASSWPVDGGSEPCDIEGSSICSSDPDGRFCIVIRRLPGYGLLFAGIQPDSLGYGDDLDEESNDDLRANYAQVLGIIPMDARRLENPTGEIDFGPVAISLPAEPSFTLREANGFPLSLKFGKGPIRGFRVNTQILGWPDQTSMRFDPRDPEPDDQEQIDALLAEWEEDYRNRASDDDRSVYETMHLDLPGGTCIRIREHFKTVEQTDGVEPGLPGTAYFQQVCVAPSVSAFVLVTADLRRPENPEEVTEFETVSREILDSLRLGFAANE